MRLEGRLLGTAIGDWHGMDMEVPWGIDMIGAAEHLANFDEDAQAASPSLKEENARRKIQRAPKAMENAVHGRLQHSGNEMLEQSKHLPGRGRTLYHSLT